MTVLPILRWGDPLLLARAAEVADPTAPEVAVLAADMAATMQEARGVGLAAPQVGVGLRLIVALDVGDREAPRDRAPLVLVNPVLEAVGDAVVEGMEGCLSIPGLRGVVPRFERVGWRGQGLDGRTIGGEAGGFLARILQHEVDHLDGVLYPMRLKSPAYMGFEPEFDRWMRARAGEGT
ncbi:MAG: peptide deformylase [Geminicoccaceae bacterium]|nr:peptide deformylase [Geminicoccaceae bacterium]